MVSAVTGHFEVAAVMIIIAFFCDGLDGRVARASRTSSQFGVEFDSLSDVIAFGVAPAMLAFSWALRPIGSLGIAVGGLYVLCGALRLARFNVQTATADKSRFVGLPIPGAAIMIASLCLAYSYFEFDSPRTLCSFMAPITLTLGGLMISRVPYPSFKTLKFEKRAQVELVNRHDGAGGDALRDAPAHRLHALGRVRIVWSRADDSRRTSERKGFGAPPGRDPPTSRMMPTARRVNLTPPQ